MSDYIQEFIKKQLIATARPIIDAVSAAGGRTLFVGGCVRDIFTHQGSKDIDLEVYDIQPDHLFEILSSLGRVDAVGKSFGILKVRLPHDIDIDVSIPRREQKVGRGHKGFLPFPDPSMSKIEAASRRDFTMNALAMDEFGNIYDFFNGRRDIADGILRHTSPAFSEDPLRVLRAMQFAARFKLRLHSETALLCRDLMGEYNTLPIERVWIEWEKLFTRGTRPSYGLQVLSDTLWRLKYPDLSRLIYCKQEPDFHPEGDVWDHTLYVVDAMTELTHEYGPEGKVVLGLAALCHDFGKPYTTVTDAQGVIRSPGHAEAGVEPTRRFLRSIGCPIHIERQVVPLVAEHMAHISMEPKPSDRTINRLANRLSPASIHQWQYVVHADHMGRPPLPRELPEVAARVCIRAYELQIMRQRPERILTGKHLIAMGKAPGKEFSIILNRAYEAQLDGQFVNDIGAEYWLKKYLLEETL